MNNPVIDKHQNESTRNGSPWTNDEVRILVNEWKKGIEFEKIGELIGRSPKSVSVKASRIGLTLRIDSHNCETVGHRRNGKLRECLSCAEIFYSAGFGNRICDKCKKNNSWQGDADHTIYN